MKHSNYDNTANEIFLNLMLLGESCGLPSCFGSTGISRQCYYCKAHLDTFQGLQGGTAGQGSSHGYYDTLDGCNLCRTRAGCS